jgi:nitroreductase
MYFYGTIFSDPADPVIAATYAMLAGEALGLGSCMLGFPGYVFQYSSRMREKYSLPRKIQPGLMVIFGTPVYQNRNAIKRRLREVTVFS